jgi:hypothetical protein
MYTILEKATTKSLMPFSAHRILNNDIMKLRTLNIFLLSGLLVGMLALKTSKSEEGMYLMSQINGLELKEAGLQIEPSEIYTPGKVGLTNALVRLGGCTGSFISNEGLIITNHHCVFSAVANASTPEENHLENGFYASDTSKEIKTSIPCRITLSFEDVSAQVLKGTESLGAKEKQEKIAENIEALEKEEQDANPDLEIAISTMSVGKYYTLFRYKLLEDVRLVYVPPKAVGKFGGESDNWMWPRHNGDFSIVRAYENGKPYTPDRFLQVNAGGTDENDFVFILGYPGRTYRHAPAEFLEYQRDHLLPVIEDWFDAYISILEEDAKNDEAKKLKYAGRIASLSNTTKNFKGKLQGFRRTTIFEDRVEEQAALEQYLMNEGKTKGYNKNLFANLKSFYAKKLSMANEILLLSQLNRSSGVFAASSFLNGYSNKYSGMTKDERSAWIEENHEKLISEYKSRVSIINKEVDAKIFAGLVSRLAEAGSPPAKAYMQELGVNTESELTAKTMDMWTKSPLADKQECLAVLQSKPEKLFTKSSKWTKPFENFHNRWNEKSGEWGANEAEINALLPKIAGLKEEFTGGTFVPDANATLRLTYGYIKGYQPEDAIYNEPFTTIEGILEKAETSGDYYMPERILKKYRTVQPADKLVHPNRKSVVVGMLYNMDTTGGNSGSPILNAKGELVGVNFDRAFSATINDFAWNEEYSRSIGVDIRYVLYTMKYLHNAEELLDEIGVEL